ncbi:MAG: inositol-3-phosphate synthase [Lentisphaeria bacterium]|nr:inositol-3-phosphate synthase [Candidatus Neomarinimicrobiota bacterium]MCF7842577.1 inositol-3-phosphate synthase [Lentisphaeria bacterium]
MKIDSPNGKLGVLIPGLGAVSTTFIAGVDAIMNNRTAPLGSVSQMATIRLGKRTEDRNPKIKDFVPLANLEDMVFGAWDLFPDNGYESAANAQVLSSEDLEAAKPTLEAVKPMKAVFDRQYVKKLDGPHVKKGATKMELAEQLMEDISRFRKLNQTSREVMIWAGSTEIYIEAGDVHSSLKKFEAGLRKNDPQIPSSMIYAYAALKSGIPYINGSPNLSVDVPAMHELADEMGVAIAGKDFKTGQTLLKTILAPGLKARMLGVDGWFSTNILGNRDGEVLDDPMSFKTKEVSKKGALDYIFQPKVYPELYKDLYHKVRINYYPPRGDAKEGWDNIDIFGWMGYKMQIKVDFLCRDSILAAPVVLDLVLFTDLAQRAGMKGIQEWLSFYFKSPMVAPKLYPEHDLFIQLTKLKNTLRWMMDEEPITHLGHEYYDGYQ